MLRSFQRSSAGLPLAYALSLAVASLLALPALVHAQATQPDVIPTNLSGVSLDANATLSNRAEDSSIGPAILRARAKAAATPLKRDQLGYVSLPRLFAEAQSAREKNALLPDELRYIGGLTQIQYVFIYPDDHDIVLAGPMEKLDTRRPLQPLGKISGRPALQFDDLVVAARIALKTNGRNPVGCTIDPPAGAMDAARTTFDKNSNKPDAELQRLLAQAIGPQIVTIIGAPEDSRLVFAVVAADFKMKRYAMGLESSPIVPIGSAADNSRVASNRFWFEIKYEPLLVSPAGDSYSLRGPRLQLKCGANSFDEKGATEKAKAYAKAFSQNIPALAASVPWFADIQNISDLLLVATLIQQDGLDRKAGWSMADAVKSVAVAKTVVPRNTETQVGNSGGSIVAGGVNLLVAPVAAEKTREVDEKEQLKAFRNRPTENWLTPPAAEK